MTVIVSVRSFDKVVRATEALVAAGVKVRVVAENVFEEGEWEVDEVGVADDEGETRVAFAEADSIEFTEAVATDADDAEVVPEETVAVEDADPELVDETTPEENPEIAA